MHGANVGTLINNAKSCSNTLLVVKDSQGAVFGALITEQLKAGEREKYYGNGTIGVWSFQTGSLKVLFDNNMHLFYTSSPLVGDDCFTHSFIVYIYLLFVAVLFAVLLMELQEFILPAVVK